MKHLRYCLFEASFGGGINEHPQQVMERLGITYQHATPQSMGDQWWFWNCENIPDELPKFLTELKLDPMKQVGYGLSLEEAKSIYDYPTEII